MVFCKRPFDQIIINNSGEIRVCCFIEKFIGNLFQDGFEKVWNSESAKEIRNSILDGSFRYCNKKWCALAARSDENWQGCGSDAFNQEIPPQMDVDTLSLGPEIVSFNQDNSCNLYCVSCRRKVYYIPKKERKRLIKVQKKLLGNNFMKNVKCFLVAGYGEPLASKVYLDLLRRIKYKNFPNLKIDILTNGNLLTQAMWNRLENIHYAINSINISIDAASAETYERVRRGGRFDRLMKNLEFVSQLRQEGKVGHFCIKFVVHAGNFVEMPEFATMGLLLKCDQVVFRPIVRFDFFKDEEFDQLAVHQKDHPKHQDFLEIVKNPIFDQKIMDLQGSLPMYRKNPPPY